MFDSYLKDLIDKVPTIDNYNSMDYRSLLSDAYLGLVKYRTYYNSHSDKTEDITESVYSLRKLGDTFEYLGVFNENITADVKKASCFIAAEAFGLLTNILNPRITNHSDFAIDNYEITLFETAMLYHIAGYDANSTKAMTVLKDSINHRVLKSEIKWALNEVISIFDGMEPPVTSTPVTNDEESIAHQNYSNLYIKIGVIAGQYRAWLKGESKETPDTLVSELEKIIRVFTKNYNSFYSTPLHIIKLLKEFINSSYVRSIFYSIPRPNISDDKYESFLKEIIAGDSNTPGQLFLWPSAIDFVEKCLPGPDTHSIVCTPTGSGKSTIAKLAISQSLNEGWVLYLAPTNALVYQIQRDLKKVRWPRDAVNIKSFIGLDEYTGLSDDELVGEIGHHIYVMTPEKCALAMRLSPQFFKTCRLCIFDEFHELNSHSRGVTIDVIFGTLLSLSPSVRLQLISAMVDNSHDLKEWLEEVSEFEANIIDLKWRPTRTMRGVIGLKTNEFLNSVENATLKARARTKMTTYTPFHGFFGLQGAWQSNQTREYRFGSIGADYTFEFTKKPVVLQSWVNNAMEQLAFHFGSAGMKTIGFFPRNKNYPFTVARNIKPIQVSKELWTDEIDKLLKIANTELGLSSKLEELLKKGVSVHTSLMTQTEKKLAELAFKSGTAKIMLATSTLSQGLNLPAEVVLLGGTELGDEYNNLNPDSLLSRKNSQFLNSIGRAGRAEFASQGLAIVIPSKPIMFRNEQYNMIAAKKAAWFLEYQDASQTVESPLTSFLDRLIDGSVDTAFISEEELSLLPFFTEGSPIPIGVLDKTFGAHKLHKKGYNAVSKLTEPVINKIHDHFMKETGAPEWIFSAARKSGVTVFVVQEMLKNITNFKLPDYFEAQSWNINSWSDFLIDILASMSPNLLRPLLFSFASFKDDKVPLYNEYIEFDTWVITEEWRTSWEKVKRNQQFYYNSKNIRELGENIFPHIKINNERTQGSFIPTVLKLLEYKGPFENLSRYAGVLVSVLEELWKEEQQDEELIIPFQLSMLPISIKNGLQDISSVAWYRFGYRNRFTALILGSIFENNITSIGNEKETYKFIRDTKKELLTASFQETQERLKSFNYTSDEVEAFFLITTES
ncbi:hypothetical protein CN510_16755 [Priestia megaterium]|uniref:DEAD/DEAH box helicase n=1 Tax=Priestia megaterium TaxID=1404 RepID=UPI000BF39E6D|nr:DEAD/DEAH box helicase [Priestia megaterium]PES94698.1 hypothetical protein CN510_16755 [Priestia megaterium]